MIFEGRADGTLVWPPRGKLGFGYDPVFMPDGFDITFGEMPSEAKHSWSPGKVGLSHRARAFAQLVRHAVNSSLSESVGRGNGLFGVYVHWPFCAAKCPYCDFNSHVHRGAFDEEAFVAAYEREIAHFAELRPDAEVASIFFGGGTPSLMQPESAGTILDAIARNWPIAANAEITLEANPNSVEALAVQGLSRRRHQPCFDRGAIAVGRTAQGARPAAFGR